MNAALHPHLLLFLSAVGLQDVLGLKLNRVTLAPDTAGLPPGASLLPQHHKRA
jgi:hypothetical protein